MKKPKGIFKRGNSWYFICYVNGQRIRRMGGATMKEAEMVMASFKAKVAKRPHLLTSEKITFVELAQEYIEKYAIPMKSKSSVRTDKGLLLHHLVPFFGDYRIGEITKAAFYEYRAARLKENVIGRDRLVSERTLNREAALLRGILSMAVEWEYLDVNLLSKVKMFHEEPRGKILPMGTLREIIDRAPLPLKYIIIVALNTGARKSEILGLTWDRVNLDTRFITLIKTKSKKNRMVYINTALLDLLSRLNESKKSQFVFPGTGKRLGKYQLDIKQAWSGLMNRLEIEDFNFHDLRGCWSSYAKGEMVARQQGMGHSSIVTTAGYTVPLQDDIKKMYESFQVWETDEKIIEFPQKQVL